MQGPGLKPPDKKNEQTTLIKFKFTISNYYIVE